MSSSKARVLSVAQAARLCGPHRRAACATGWAERLLGLLPNSTGQGGGGGKLALSP